MSKRVKDLVTKTFQSRLDGVEDCLVADVIGLDANSTVKLRKELRAKNINLMVVKNSLAQRATEGTSLAPAFEGIEGTACVVWGAEDFISLTKEIAGLDKGEEYDVFKARGGVMDGEALSVEKVHEISKWPNRSEQLSILSGQMTSAWTALQSQLCGPGGQLASQIKKKADEE